MKAYGDFQPIPILRMGIAGQYPNKFVWLIPHKEGLSTTYEENGELWGRLDDGKILIRNYCGVTASHRLQLKNTDTVFKLERVDKGQDELICKIVS